MRLQSYPKSREGKFPAGEAIWNTTLVSIPICPAGGYQDMVFLVTAIWYPSQRKVHQYLSPTVIILGNRQQDSSIIPLPIQAYRHTGIHVSIFLRYPRSLHYSSPFVNDATPGCEAERWRLSEKQVTMQVHQASTSSLSIYGFQ